MFSSVAGLGVVISPGGKHLISLALAGASVGLDLYTTNGLEIENLDNTDYSLVNFLKKD